MAVRQRKNFLPTLILALIAWLGWGWLVYRQSPSSDLLIFSFFLLLFLGLFLTSCLALANSRRGFFLTSLILLFLLFRYWQIASPLNLILLSGIFISLEVYNRRH